MSYYIDDSIIQIAKTTLSSSKRAISFVCNYFFKLDPTNLKITFTWSASSINTYKDYKNLFNINFDFPLNPPSTTSLQPPMRFSNSLNTGIHYLLEESSQIEIKDPNILFDDSTTYKGTLKQSQNHGLYLDLDDSFIDSFYNLINDQNILKPPSFYPTKSYINVISPQEYKNREVETIRELGETFSFTIKGLYSIYTENDPTLEKVWFLKIDSPQLEDLRYKYHLSPKFGGHSFFISIAVKHSMKTFLSYPLMRINIAFIAA
ncbi:hypothetical protein KJ671_03440 [Patescibacteria group bacterium]|nr:hypothetical protein [Patescibacteria group bacterium]